MIDNIISQQFHFLLYNLFFIIERYFLSPFYVSYYYHTLCDSKSLVTNYHFKSACL